MKYEIQITMEENGAMAVKGNASGPALVGLLEMAKNAVMKNLMGPAVSKKQETSTGLEGEPNLREKGTTKDSAISDKQAEKILSETPVDDDPSRG